MSGRRPHFMGLGMTSPRTRERMIGRLREQGIRNPRVLRVMAALPRHLFVDEALASRAYEDSSLPIGYGQTLSQPYMVARMTEVLLEAGPLDQVLEIGTGSGYQTAVLASLAKRVYTVERIEALSRQAQRRLQRLELRNVRFRHGDGHLGFPEYAPFSGILVSAAPEGIPAPLIAQLDIGAALVLPVATENGQILTRVSRTLSGYERQPLEQVSFVPLLGGTH